MQVRPQRDWPRARSIQGLLQQRDGGMYARARLARSHPGVEKTFDRRGTARAGSTRHASECGSVRGSVEGAARGSRASREGDSSRARLERNRAESIEWQQKNGLLGGGPAHGGRVCTSARKVAALRALVKTAIAADAGTKEPSQPKVAHSMPPSAAAPYTRSQGQRASSRNRPVASEATRAPRHRVRLPNAPSKLSGTAAATASAYPEQQPGHQPPRHHRGTTRATPRNHPRSTHGTRPRKKDVTE